MCRSFRIRLHVCTALLIRRHNGRIQHVRPHNFSPRSAMRYSSTFEEGPRVKTLIEAIEKVAPFIGAYPPWFQYCIALWVMLTAGAVVGLIFLSPAANKQSQAPTPANVDVGTLNDQLKKVVQSKLAVPTAVAERFADITKSPDAGIVRLQADGSQLERAVRGGGTYYAFLRRDQEYNYGSDIQLQAGQFKTGFAGANYGYFLRLGRIPIRQLLDSASAVPPTWLGQSRRDAWQHMWQYQPPRDIKEIRAHQSAARSLVKGGVPIAESTPAVVAEAYLIRSIQVDTSDALVAFQVIDRNDDGSMNLVWKVVKVFDTPVSIGKE